LGQATCARRRSGDLAVPVTGFRISGLRGGEREEPNREMLIISNQLPYKLGLIEPFVNICHALLLDQMLFITVLHFVKRTKSGR
jgi:hypothetical protein